MAMAEPVGKTRLRPVLVFHLEAKRVGLVVVVDNGHVVPEGVSADVLMNTTPDADRTLAHFPWSRVPLLRVVPTRFQHARPDPSLYGPQAPQSIRIARFCFRGRVTLAPFVFEGSGTYACKRLQGLGTERCNSCVGNRSALSFLRTNRLTEILGSPLPFERAL